MGWLDKTKALLGLGPPSPAAAPDPKKPRANRPALPDVEAGPAQSLDDVLALREEGDREGARALLATLNRGRGLRVVLRAAAALEAEDRAEVDRLREAARAEAAGWKLPLQLAAAGSPSAARRLGQAAAAGAPAWAIAWARATASDEAEKRAGLVELLIADPALARTVAARDLHVEGAVADASAAERYAAFAHGRECVRRFGVEAVEALVDLALGAKA